jgi:hypothetical protein
MATILRWKSTFMRSLAGVRKTAFLLIRKEQEKASKYAFKMGRFHWGKGCFITLQKRDNKYFADDHILGLKS